MPKSSSQTESLAVGGQAVMEGVMMRNKEKIVIAVRTPDNKIVLKKENYKSIGSRYPLLGWPFIRGIIGFVEIMFIGMKAMIWSSNKALGEEEEFSTKELIFTVLFAIIFSLLLFKLLPLFLATIVQEKTQSSNIIFNLVDGFIKIGLLVGYIAIIGQMKDVKRLFQYHGAEHKSINCYEQGKALTTKNVLSCSRFHPRCGTTFLLFVFFISILFYMVIPLDVGFWQKLLLRIAFLPLISGVSYELIKLGGRHHQHPIMKILLAPGMLLQRLTTKEPDEKQAAVAIKSLKAAL
jgi:uncharacterized protein YqhQ